MYKIVRKDKCIKDKDYKRVYLMGAVNEGDPSNTIRPEDPMLYTKIGLSQNPIERLSTVPAMYKKRKLVTIFGQEQRWMPRNFSLLGYTEPLPFAASVETMAHDILTSVYKDREALDVKVLGLKDWYRPTEVWVAVFSIFAAIQQCYKDLQRSPNTLIKWTVPTLFPNAGNSIISIEDDYLHTIKGLKKHSKKIKYENYMNDYCHQGKHRQEVYLFNKWIQFREPDLSMKIRRHMLDTLEMFLEIRTSGATDIHLYIPGAEEFTKLYKMFKTDLEFHGAFKRIEVGIS